MDENKTVELSDGRVLLNSRDNANQGYRKIAHSTDGGATYGPVTQDTEMPDPGQQRRHHPDAPVRSTGIGRSKEADLHQLELEDSPGKRLRPHLLRRRRHLARRPHHPPRLLRLLHRHQAGGRQFGVLYEANYTDNMPFASFDDAWLNYACAPLSVPAVTTAPGVTQQVPVTVTNQEAGTLSGATATVYTPSGWTAPIKALMRFRGGSGRAYGALRFV